MTAIYKVWMIVHPTKGFWYSPPASNATEAWSNAKDWEQFLAGGQFTTDWIEDKKREGWRAKEVNIALYNR